MKDLYTFDVSEKEAIATYDKVRETYARILNRIGIPFAAADADSGNIGGSLSHEYHVLSKGKESNVISSW